MDSVPVVLEWSLSLAKMNSSLIELFKRFITNTSEWYLSLIGFSQNSMPYCRIHNVTSSTYNQSRLQCFCPPGFQGSPYLLQPCQGNYTSSIVQSKLWTCISLSFMLELAASIETHHASCPYSFCFCYFISDIDECKGPNMCPAHGRSNIGMLNFWWTYYMWEFCWGSYVLLKNNWCCMWLLWYRVCFVLLIWQKEMAASDLSNQNHPSRYGHIFPFISQQFLK